jgi:thiol-disulfide isomerase/thioredoxin
VKLRVLGLFLLALALAAPVRAAGDDAARFKSEHEVMNGPVTFDGEHQYRHIKIPEDNPFIYTEGEVAKALLATGTGILYMGFPECPWCRTLLPALIAAYEECGYGGSIYYYNAFPDRDVLSLSESGEIVVETEGAAVYREMVEILYDFLGPYKGLNDESVRRIYFPTTVFFKDGAVLSAHLATIDGQEGGYDELTDDQFLELKSALIDQIKALN